MRGLIILFLLCSIVGFKTSINAQQHNNVLASEDLVKALMKEHDIPALGIGIIREGKISSTKVYGELFASKPAPLYAIFNVASLTKPVITMLTLKLVNLGKWELDEPLANIYIDPDVKADPNAYKLTTRHILSHQTGFVNWRWLHSTKRLTFDFEPGTKFQYSGEGFEYLRKAIEAKFNTTLDQLCEKLVFKPLQMKNSRLIWDKNLQDKRFAKWHDKDGKNTYPTWKPNKPNAADDLMTTIDDYSRFGAAVINGFGLPEHLFKDMVTPQVKIGKFNAMCLGWEYIGNLRNNEYAILHTGSDIGVKTLIVLFPESKQGLIVFTNSDNGYLLYEKLISDTFGSLGTSFLQKAKEGS